VRPTAPGSAGQGPDGDTSTRESLLRAATTAFSTSGFEGTSVRHIERMAQANRGLVTYHFGSKYALWQQVIIRQMEYFHDEFERYAHLLNLVSEPERARVLLRVYAHFAAQHPDFFRILVLEGGAPSPRLTWLVDEYLNTTRKFFFTLTRYSGTSRAEAMAYYLMTGASSYMFAVAAQCKAMFDLDVTDAEFVDRYVDFVADIDYSEILQSD
jgi:AcrR family transcriptional regulator